MLNKINAKEKLHLAWVKSLPCGVCGSQEGSEAHHLIQHRQYLCIPLCPSCHRNPLLGWHGQKRMWAIHKKTELDVLNETIRLMKGDSK